MPTPLAPTCRIVQARGLAKKAVRSFLSSAWESGGLRRVPSEEIGIHFKENFRLALSYAHRDHAVWSGSACTSWTALHETHKVRVAMYTCTVIHERRQGETHKQLSLLTSSLGFRQYLGGTHHTSVLPIKGFPLQGRRESRRNTVVFFSSHTGEGYV